MMYVAVPSDQNNSLKAFQKLSKYKYLEIEVTKMWKLKTNIIPVVIGALGIIKMESQISLIKYLVSPLYRKSKKLYLQAPLKYSKKSYQSKTYNL